MNDWKMTYSGPMLMLDTAYGQVEVTFTDNTHAHVSAYSDGERKGDITYRNRHWYVSIHVYAQYGWGERPLMIVHDDGRREYTGEYLHQFTEQFPDGGWKDKHIPPTYRAKIVAAIQSAVSEFVEANPKVLTDAQHNHLTRELERAIEDQKQAREVFEEKRSKVNKLLRALTALDEKWEWRVTDGKMQYLINGEWSE